MLLRTIPKSHWRNLIILAQFFKITWIKIGVLHMWTSIETHWCSAKITIILSRSWLLKLANYAVTHPSWLTYQEWSRTTQLEHRIENLNLTKQLKTNYSIKTCQCQSAEWKQKRTSAKIDSITKYLNLHLVLLILCPRQMNKCGSIRMWLESQHLKSPS